MIYQKIQKWNPLLTNMLVSWNVSIFIRSYLALGSTLIFSHKRPRKSPRVSPVFSKDLKVQCLRLPFQLASPVASNRFYSLAKQIFHYPDIKTSELAPRKHSFLSKYWFMIFANKIIHSTVINSVHCKHRASML